VARASLVPQILTAVVAGLRTYSTPDVTFRAPTSSATGATVYDGPEWRAYDGPDAAGWLVIGWGGEDVDIRPTDGEQPDPAMSGSQDVRAIATSSPREQPQDEIECVAVYGAGALDTATARAKAWALVDAVHSFLTADPKVGIVPSADGQVMWVQLTSRSTTQWINSGSRCAVRFTITAYTRT
jgi:hypothetical protein